VVAQPLAGRIVWTIAVASLPLFIVLVGYHRWREICPLAFFSQIPVLLRRPGTRRASATLERNYYYVALSMFFVGLWLRLIWTNGDGVAIAIFFVLLSLMALLVGVLFTGKTWCNYVCPVSFIEKIYTEPHGLRETPNSQCTKCTACKKACPDINEENGYWKEIQSKPKRFAYFVFPGLVLGFYSYYFLQAGTWDYYFGGSWTDEPGVILRAFLPGFDEQTQGFFFLPGVPRAVAAFLTLAASGLLSLEIFTLLERPVGRWLRQRDPGTSVIRVRHVMLGLAAFSAFTIFYTFAGQPTLRKAAWLPTYAGIGFMVTATLLLVRRLTRTQQAFAEQTLGRHIIRRWEWSDTPPTADLRKAYVIHTARASERERAYMQVLSVYQDAIRETLAEGFVTRSEVQRLETLRSQLQIKKVDHDRVMAALAEEERTLLTDPSKYLSAEKRLQMETYKRALERHLERTLLAAEQYDDSFIRQLRQEFGVSREEHAAAVDDLLSSGQWAAEQIAGALKSSARATYAIQALAAQSSPANAVLADLLRSGRARAVERLVRGLGLGPEDDASRALRDGLCSDDASTRASAIDLLRRRLPPQMQDQIGGAQADVSPASDVAPGLTRLLSEYTDATDPYTRALALYALSQHDDSPDAATLAHSSDDEHELVRETAVALKRRYAGEAAGRSPMLTVEKMIALRQIPIFASVGPEALEELARSSFEAIYARDDALCLEGETGNEVFILLAGEARVVHGPSPDAAPVNVETIGSVIGELAVLEAGPRSASVFASTDGTHALRLSGSAFRGVLDADPAVAEGVIRTLARRLRTRSPGR
jgi:hypothetical protein